MAAPERVAAAERDNLAVVEAHAVEHLAQVRRALRTGPPSWWPDYYHRITGRHQPFADDATLDLSALAV